MKSIFRIVMLGGIWFLVTFTCAFWLIDFQNLSERFWLVVSPILLGELFIVIHCVSLLNRFRQSSFPMNFSRLMLPLVYWLFTLGMAFMYNSRVQNTTIGIWQLFGLLLFLALYIAITVAAENIEKEQQNLVKQFSPREEFRLQFSMVSDILKLRFATDVDLLKSLAKSADLIRFAADSLPETEDEDGKVINFLREIGELAGNGDREQIMEKLSGLNVAMRSRESRIKANRK